MYSFVAANIASIFFSQTQARPIEIIPKTFFALSSAASRSQESSSGSTYMVDCALYISKFPARFILVFSSQEKYFFHYLVPPFSVFYVPSASRLYAA